MYGWLANIIGNKVAGFRHIIGSSQFRSASLEFLANDANYTRSFVEQVHV